LSMLNARIDANSAQFGKCSLVACPYERYPLNVL